MGTVASSGRVRFGAAILVVVVSVVLAGCDYGHRFIGPTVSVKNDSGKPVVVRIDQSKWAIGQGESRQLGEQRYGASGATIEILDPTSCEVGATFAVSFEANLDPLVTVAASGPITQLDQTQRQMNALDRAVESQNLCEQPADGWTVSIVNRAGSTHYVVARDEAGKAISEYFGFMPSSTLTLRLPMAVNSVPGSLDVVDAECQIIARADHPGWGTYVVTIDAGKATIEKGPILDDHGLWPYLAGESCPVATPSPT